MRHMRHNLVQGAEAKEACASSAAQRADGQPGKHAKAAEPAATEVRAEAAPSAARDLASDSSTANRAGAGQKAEPPAGASKQVRASVWIRRHSVPALLWGRVECAQTSS